MIQLVCKKLEKHRTPEEISEALEEELADIRAICEAAKDFAPDYDCQRIYEKLNSEG